VQACLLTPLAGCNDPARLVVDYRSAVFIQTWDALLRPQCCLYLLRQDEVLLLDVFLEGLIEIDPWRSITTFNSSIIAVHAHLLAG
jgi:hypothetical protein